MGPLSLAGDRKKMQPIAGRLEKLLGKKEKKVELLSYPLISFFSTYSVRTLSLVRSMIDGMQVLPSSPAVQCSEKTQQSTPGTIQYDTR